LLRAFRPAEHFRKGAMLNTQQLVGGAGADYRHRLHKLKFLAVIEVKLFQFKLMVADPDQASFF
jgi:hypothetical protein